MRLSLSAAVLAAAAWSGPVGVAAAAGEPAGASPAQAQAPGEPQGVPAPTLTVGDKAPALGSVAWVQGDAVSAWEKGTVYVLDFWATWCGPCVKTIPELNALSKAYADKKVKVIGVAIWPQEGMKPVADFVKEKASEMTYTIAEDKDGAVASAFMAATGSESIPTVMIINGEGRLAWVGHPLNGMPKALGEIVEGKYDVDAAAAKARRQQQVAKDAEPLLMEANSLAAEGKWEDAIERVDRLIAMDFQVAQLSMAKFQVLMGPLNKPKEAYAYLDGAIDGPLADEWMLLNQVAWVITSAPDLPERDLGVARKAIDRAVVVSGGKDAAVLDTQARVFFAQNEVAKAVETQTRALTFADAGIRDEMQEQLDTYKAALEKQQGKGPADGPDAKPAPKPEKSN